MYFILWVYFQALIFKATILLFCAVFSGKMGHKMTTPLSFQQKRQWSHRKWTIATWQSQHDGHGGSSVRYLRFFCILFSCNFWFLEGNFPGAPQSVRKRKKGLTSQLIRKEILLSFECCCIIYILFVIHGECFTMFYININSESCWAKSDFLTTDIPPTQHSLLKVPNISFSTSTNNHPNLLMRTNY